MSNTLNIYIIALVLLNILGCAYFLYATAKQPKKERDTKTTGHVWDDDLTELNNPLPRWWLGLFYLSIVFAIAYLVLYPGLGKFAGQLDWSQEQAYLDEKSDFNKNHAALYEQYSHQSFSELQNSEAAMATAHNLFSSHCAGCHGSDGKGTLGYPNLTDDDWLYGNSPEHIQISIQVGRRGNMPSFEAALDDAELNDLTNYLLSFSGRAGFQTQSIHQGRALFQQNCSVCHGNDAKGNPAFGAPNLTDATWLYGSTPEQIKESLLKGRMGNMPAHQSILSEEKIRLFTAYVLFLVE